ncbi:sigma-70 family RNA polymerase sigma factor [Jatrophihabitans cynanchi]|uniref:Sigma-70 family RNA polymerase sigma factor n=1 Tax=Jatrophihabitans cynanchi TaxID=2944128 RepID=A0ABY7JYZ2_9ACTN|nr:sigma-70 family RNA polymerase sigma factor [Jatrophihabitans sp. SB3-54]WAX56940.1 sigma-70 family RNA polymerase sigma factor [Jatrophihabitans sp. SB3-54]
MDADRERFEELFRRHYAPVVRYAVRRVGVDAAQEVVADTFLTAWRRLDSVPEHALPWLYATARRLIANEVRRQARGARLGQKIAGGADGAVPDHAEEIADRLRVGAALQQLTERDREVLRLAEWERLDSADSARVLGCSVAAFKVRLHRARRRLAAALDSGACAPTPVEVLNRGDRS